ncbi:hypothetical protein WA588_004164 [Blastocystis sp. NMH]
MIGFDANERVLRCAEQNTRLLGADGIRFERRDFVHLIKQYPAGRKVILSNPPYGYKSKAAKESLVTLYRQLEEWILSLHSRDELAAASLLIPSFILDHHASNAFLQLINTSNRTSNHGLKVDLVTLSPLC